MTSFTESVLEEAVLETLASLGWQVVFGPQIAPLPPYLPTALQAGAGLPSRRQAGGEPAAERGDYREVLLAGRLHTALEHLNPSLPPEALEDAFRKVVNLPHLHPGLGTNNRAFHKMLTDGVDVEYRTAGGDVRGDKAWLVDFAHPENNDFLAVN